MHGAGSTCSTRTARSAGTTRAGMAPARQLIEASLGAMFGATVEPSPSERIAAGRAAVAAGCDDPLVLYLLGRAIFNADALSGEPEELFRRAFEGMKTVRYDRAVARFAATGLHARYDESARGPGPARAGRHAGAAVVQGVARRRQLRAGRRRRAGGAASRAVPARSSSERVEPRGHGRARRGALGRPVGEALLLRAPSPARGREGARDGIRAPRHERAVGRASSAWNALARRDYEEAHRLRPDRPGGRLPDDRGGGQRPKATRASAPGSTARSPRRWTSRRRTISCAPTSTRAGAAATSEMLALGREALETRRFDTEVPAELLWTVLEVRADQR